MNCILCVKPWGYRDEDRHAPCVHMEHDYTERRQIITAVTCVKKYMIQRKNIETGARLVEGSGKDLSE